MAGGGNIPYIGSKISLITTSDIRYEGILYTLNREESTIAVQNVRSFGTEGRRKPEVPMSNEIYDFIIFRGKDLKDLTVLQSSPDPPAPYPGAGGSEFLDSQGSSMYGQPMPPPADQSSMNSFQRPSIGSTAAARNGFAPSSLQTGSAPMPKPYSGGYVSPASSASRVAERNFNAGMPVRQPYSAVEMQGASLSSPPVRPPLYEEESNGAVQRISNDGAKGGIRVDQKIEDPNLDKDAKARGRGKGGAQKKSLAEVLRFHKRAEELIVKMMRGQSSANIGPGELRAMSEMNPSVYHFYLDFVNYCCPSHTVQSDEQQWEMLCKALKKHFEKEFGSNQQNQKPPQPQRPNNTLGDFITIQTDSKAAKKTSAKAPRGGGRVGRGTGRGDKKDIGQGSGEWDGSLEDEAPAQSSTWACPRCTLRNENLLLECAACGTSKQQAALWAEFPPLG
jgi:hypothetical protein